MPVVAAAVLSACVEPQQPEQRPPSPVQEVMAREPAPRPEFHRLNCGAGEAVLLSAPLDLFSSPDGSGEVLTLSAATPVYLCRQEGGAQAVAWPQPGTPADCRSRPDGNACPVGWTRSTPAVEISG